jgi:glucose-6-phosphate isomerase
MTGAQLPPLRFDYSGALVPDYGVTRSWIDELAPRLSAVRDEIIQTDPLFESVGPVSEDKGPLDELDAGFIRLPERLLSDYRATRPTSELGRLLATARRIRESCDRVVVLGIGGSYMGARALMDACCQPYHNELSRGDRGGRPRMYFEGNNMDNDSVAGLMHLLREGKDADPADWAIVVISKSGGTLETAAAFRLFLAELTEACRGDVQRLRRLVVPITGSSGRLFDLATSLGCTDMFPVPDGVGGRFSVFSSVGLLPAAILGIDVVRLLEGAVQMNRHFESQPIGTNTVLAYAAVSYLMCQNRDAHIRVLSVWANALESLGLWYDQLLAESLGKNELGATPLTVVNTRDLHSRAQQHQQGRHDKLIHNVIVQRWRSDPLQIPRHADGQNQDELNKLAGRAIPELMNAAIAGTNAAYLSGRRPTTNLYLPAVDEASIGQLMQMLMLATVVEGRLMGVNPYGQPGVELYKSHMNQQLGIR